MESATEQEQIRVVPCNWGADAEAVLSNERVHADIANLRRQVETGGAVLFRVESASGRHSMVGYYVLRVDGDEGVLLAGAGRHEAIDLTASIMPIIEKQFIGCRSIRIHTGRAGLVKKLAALGYEGREFVMGKKLEL